MRDTPEMDLGFAVSITDLDADNTFKRMKDAIRVIIDKYGVLKIKYSLVVFGTAAAVQRPFGDSLPSREALKNSLDSISRLSGQPDLKKGLETSLALFKRTNVKRVLVVIIDNKSVNSPQQLQEAIEPLERWKKVLIITVLVGNAADPKEMQVISPNKGYLVEVPRDQDPSSLAHKIMEKVFTGKTCLTLLLSVNSSYNDRAICFNNNNNNNNNLLT